MIICKKHHTYAGRSRIILIQFNMNSKLVRQSYLIAYSVKSKHLTLLSLLIILLSLNHYDWSHRLDIYYMHMVKD